jgi:hypothetical protein
LVKLGQEVLAKPQSRAAGQLVDGGVNSNELDTISTIADAVKTTGEQAAGARTQGAVSQADLDLQDGTVLAHLERVMRAFNRAHERDASIPRLLPIATRAVCFPWVEKLQKKQFRRLKSQPELFYSNRYAHQSLWTLDPSAAYVSTTHCMYIDIHSARPKYPLHTSKVLTARV